VVPTLLPLAVLVVVAMAVALYFILRGYKPPPRGDALPASVPITLSEPDLERLAGAAAEAIRSREPDSDVTARSLVDAVRRGSAEVTSSGVLDEVLCFRYERHEISVDRAGKVVGAR
jgi:hypothetical protein